MSTHPKPVLVVTRPTPLEAPPPEVAERVNRDLIVRRAGTPESLTSDGLVELSDGTSAFLVTPFDRIDASFLGRVAASVKIVARRSVGYDHIDSAAAARRHIAVAYAPGVLTDGVADATILLLLGASRHAYEAQRFLRAGKWADGVPLTLMGRQLTEKGAGDPGDGANRAGGGTPGACSGNANPLLQPVAALRGDRGAAASCRTGTVPSGQAGKGPVTGCARCPCGCRREGERVRSMDGV